MTTLQVNFAFRPQAISLFAINFIVLSVLAPIAMFVLYAIAMGRATF